MYREALAGTWLLIQSFEQLKVLFVGYEKAPAGTWLLVQSFEKLKVRF